jgi:hypothetical protein
MSFHALWTRESRRFAGKRKVGSLGHLNFSPDITEKRRNSFMQAWISLND